MVPIRTADGHYDPSGVFIREAGIDIDRYCSVHRGFLMVLSALVSIVLQITRPDVIVKNIFLPNVFHVSNGWLLTRLLRTIFTVLAVFQRGPEWLISKNTGGLPAYDLIPVLFVTFLLAG
ncbi:hypothetical protein ACFSCZ_09760 [Siminovitchia sediminis]|uniref:Uncharacterized protein n=1 Tax=Siminovitchia sediminis TaxID=1274353 RepID=A0ABW4KID5_9BACI